MSQPLLVAQHEALNDFLDDLLTEDGTGSQAGSDDSMLTTESAGEPGSASSEIVLPAQVRSDDAVSQFVDDGRIPILPDWGLQAFQAMVFKVGELSLAIPLTALAGVIEWQPERAEPASADGLHLGDYQHAGQSVSVIDIARLVFAGSPFDDLIKTRTRPQITRIILINNEKYGLACDAVYEVITIEPTRVNWRSARTRRQWLAGTLLDERIAILGVESASRILSNMLADFE